MGAFILPAILVVAMFTAFYLLFKGGWWLITHPEIFLIILVFVGGYMVAGHIHTWLTWVTT